MADAAKAAKDAAKGAVSKTGSALTWGFNQLHPFGQNGKLSRTIALMGTTALVGSAIATGGIAAPLALAGDFGMAAAEGVGEAFSLAATIATGADWTAASENAVALGQALTAGAPI